MTEKDVEKVNECTSEESLIEEQLPAFTHQEIRKYFTDQDLGRLTQTSKTMFFYHHKPLEEKAAKMLSTLVIRGERVKALKMIDANPKLLLIPSEASDHSGRTYKGFTAFQLALLCHDFTLWKEMEPYFDKQMSNGYAEKKKQFKAIFPAGIPQQKPYNFTTLIQVISKSSSGDIWAALRKKSNDTEICKALTAFRKTFTDLAMKETFFNLSHLIKALHVYDVQYDHWRGPKNQLFWCQVIGYIQRFLPACYYSQRFLPLTYAQAFSQGLFSSSSGLGFNCGIYHEGPVGSIFIDNSGVYFGLAQSTFDDLRIKNRQELLGLEHCMWPSPSGCTIS